jgi:L-2,4-diaminobutyrate decarboxylase
MSTEKFSEAFGSPSDASQVLSALQQIIADLLHPCTPFLPPQAADFSLDCASGQTLLSILEEVQHKVSRHAIHSRHPLAMAHMVPPPSTVSVIADLIIGLMNQCAFIWEEAPVAAAIEHEVLRWLSTQLGLPSGGQGLLTSGGTASNCLATFAAVDRARQRAGRIDDQWCVIASDQSHMSLDKAVALTGLHNDALVRMPTDARGRITPGLLAELSSDLRKAGRRLIMVVCTAGTTNAGTIEPVDEMITVARDHDAWLHVDAAYGGATRLSRHPHPSSAQWRLADSVSWDPHKSLYVSYASGALFLQDPRALGRLSVRGDYALKDEAARDAGTRHLDGSRRFEALKLWMAVKYFGRTGFAEITDQTLHLARIFSDEIQSFPSLRLVDEPDTNIVCFRYVADHLSEEELDAANLGLQRSLFFSEGPLLSSTRIGRRTVLRAVLLNPQLEARDIPSILQRICAEGSRWTASHHTGEHK